MYLASHHLHALAVLAQVVQRVRGLGTNTLAVDPRENVHGIALEDLLHQEQTMLVPLRTAQPLAAGLEGRPAGLDAEVAEVEIGLGIFVFRLDFVVFNDVNVVFVHLFSAGAVLARLNDAGTV